MATRDVKWYFTANRLTVNILTQLGLVTARDVDCLAMSQKRGRLKFPHAVRQLAERFQLNSPKDEKNKYPISGRRTVREITRR